MNLLAQLLARLGLGREASPAASTAPTPQQHAQGIPVAVVGQPAPAPSPASPARLRAMFPALGDPEGWAAALAPAMARRGINSRTRADAFLAQVGHESAGLTRLVENLNYSPSGLLSTWPSRFSRAEAEMLGRTAAHPADQRAIAERAYGGRMGNAREGAGDGWAFRGRGLIQLTGRDNYTAAAGALGVPLADLPAYLETRSGAAEASAWWWQQHGCNELADAGDFEALTRRINGGTHGLADRLALLERAQTAALA